MLEIRPNCELCDLDLSPETTDARICSYECTYCAKCVDTVLQNVCPTCGCGFAPRPIRPATAWRPEKLLGLRYHPPGETRYHTSYTSEDIEDHVKRLKDLPPELR